MEGDLEYRDRGRDGFDAMLSVINKEQIRLWARLVVDTLAHVDRARRGKCLEPGCDVHGISVDVAVVGENITGIDADPQSDPIGSIGLALGKAALDIEPAANRVKCA